MFSTHKIPAQDSNFNHIDFDTVINKIRGGNYIDAKNITQSDINGNLMDAVQIVRGNKKEFTIEDVTAQNKIYQVSGWGADGTTTHDILVRWGIIEETQTYTEGATLQDSMDNAIEAVSDAFDAQLQTYTITPSADYTYFNIELTSYPYLEYYIFQDDEECVVYQEAISPDMVGNNMVIGSRFVNGELFIWSTPDHPLPTSTIQITSVTNDAGVCQIHCATNHGLVQYQKVTITGGSDASNINGSWNVGIVSDTAFDLFYSQYNSTTTGTVTTYPESVGEIGVVTYDPNVAVYSYTRLVRSKALNLRIWKQVDCDIERNSEKVSLYWTDDYNRPRVMYYYGAYVADGFITVINPDGRYSYETLDEESRLFISLLDIRVANVAQSLVGGNLKAGNKRYTVRLITDDGVVTECAALSNPISTYVANPVASNAYSNAAQMICGDDGPRNTPKLNTIKIEGIVPGIFRYIELIAVEYTGISVSVTMVARVPVGNNSVQYIDHTGFETGSEILSTTILNEIPINYERAKNLRIMDRRMILSNLTAYQDPDLSAFALNINYAIKNDVELDSVGTIDPLQTTTITYGEYQIPESVFNFTGYMDNEYYRFGIRFKFRDSSIWTKVYFVVDANFSTAAFLALGGQRIGALTSYDLTTDAQEAKPLPRYISFSNIDFDYILEDGRVLKDVFSNFEIVRAENNTPDIPYTGVLRLGQAGGTGGDAGIHFLPVSDAAAYPAPGYTAHRETMTFLSPDVFLGLGSLTSSSFSVLNYGNPKSFFQNNSSGTFREYTGYLGGLNNPQNAVSIAATYCARGGAFSVGGGILNYIQRNLDPTIANEQNGAYGIKTSTNLTNVSGQTDYALYYGQIYAPVFGKYGNPEETFYISCGFYDTTDHTSADTFDVWGGDTFIQKTFIHTDYPNALTSGGISFYSQNRINSQMRYISYDPAVGTGTIPVFPVLPSVPDTAGQATWLTATEEGQFYDHGYDIRNNLVFLAPYDSRNMGTGEYPVRFVWSDLKSSPDGADAFRKFLPAAFRDVDLKYGEITHMEVIGDQLYSIQPSMRMRQFFNSTNILISSIGTEAIMGDAGVMSRDGVMLNDIGTRNKWSCALSHGLPNVSLYSIDVLNKCVTRFGPDGTEVISYNKAMSWWKNNLRFVIDNDTPAAGYGISTIWDDKKKEIRWTVRSRKTVGGYSSLVTYAISSEVFLQGSDFDGLGDIYVATAETLNQNPVTNPSVWTKISLDNKNYYSAYTIAYSEKKKGIISFYTGLPKSYLRWGDSFFTQRASDSLNTGGSNFYYDGTGDYAEWYNDGETSQVEDGYIEFIFNDDLNLLKEYCAVWFASEIAPYRIEFTTKTHASYLIASDFEKLDDQFFSEIKNDTLTSATGVNNDDTSNLFGQYLKIKFIFHYKEFQKLNEAVLKEYQLSRNYGR